MWKRSGCKQNDSKKKITNRVGEMCDLIVKHFKYMEMKGKKSYEVTKNEVSLIKM